MGEDGWEKKVRCRKAYYPVWQALGRSSFVNVRPSRWQYAVHWLRLKDVVSLVLGWCSQNTCPLPPPPMGTGKLYPQRVRNAFTHVEKRISEGIEPLTSSSGVPTFCEVQATACLTHSPTNLYPLMDKCTKSLERIAPCRIHTSLLQMSLGVRTMLDSMHYICAMNTSSLKISPRNKL